MRSRLSFVWTFDFHESTKGKVGLRELPLITTTSPACHGASDKHASDLALMYACLDRHGGAGEAFIIFLYSHIRPQRAVPCAVKICSQLLCIAWRQKMARWSIYLDGMLVEPACLIGNNVANANSQMRLISSPLHFREAIELSWHLQRCSTRQGCSINFTDRLVYNYYFTSCVE